MSFNTSEHLSSSYQSYGDLNEEQHLAEDQKKTFLDQINNLTQQNTILKAQFDQAISATNQLEDVIKKNSELSIELRSVIAEKDQLQNRLDISLKANEENCKIFEKEKESFHQQLIQMASDKEIEVANANKFCAGKLNMMEIQINQLQSSKSQLEIENKLLEAKIEKLNQDATKYFQLAFDGIDSLINYFEQLNNNAIERNCQVTNVSDSQVEENDHKKCKKQIFTLQKHCEKLILKVKKLQNKMKSNENKYISEIDCCNEQINQLKKEILNSQEKHSQIISDLEETNHSLQIEVEKLRKASSQQVASTLSEIIVQPKSSSSQPIEDNYSILNSYTCKKQIAELTEANESLLQEKQEVIAASKELEQKVNSMTSKITLLEKQHSDLLFTIDKLGKEKSTSEIVHNETLAELNRARELLKLRESSEQEKKCKLKKQIENLEATISQKESKIEQQMSHIQNLAANSEVLMTENADASRNLQILTNENKEFRNQIVLLKEKNQDLLDKLQSTSEIRVEDLIPPTAWRYKGFDAILSDKIELIINSNFSPVIKINKIYSIIADHYDGVIKIKEEKVNHMESHLHNVRNQLDRLFSELAKTLSVGVFTFDSIINGNDAETLISSVSNCVKGYNELKQRNNELNLIVGRVVDEFGQCSDMPSYISSIRQNYEAQTNTLKKQIRTTKELKKAQKVAELRFKAEKKVLENQVSQLNSMVCKLKSSNSELKKQVDKTSKEIKTIKAKKDSNSNMEDVEESVRSENEQVIQKLSESFSNERTKIIAQIERIQSENLQLKAIISDQELSIGKLKEQIQLIKYEIKEKEEINSQLKNERNDEMLELKQTCDSEKTQLVETYETALSAIQKQIENQRQDAESLMNDLSNAKSKLKEIRSMNSKLKKEKQNLEEILNEKQEKENMDRKLQELSTKQKLAAIESKYSKMLDEQKTQNEQEKKKIYAFAANELKSYICINTTESIDERGYQSLISNVRKELDRLSTSEAKIRQITSSVYFDAKD